MADKLNKEQKLAVETVKGPVLILAGAGSGKTRVLTQRVFYLIDKGFARPENILAVTFTNKAAGEMKERIGELLSSHKGKATFQLPWVGTFHSICVKILKRNAEHAGLSQQFTIYDIADQLDSVKEAMKKLDIDSKNFKPRAVLSYISTAKSELIGPKAYATYAAGYFQETVARIYPEYQSILQNNSAVDFDDLIMKTVLLFQKDPEILKRYQQLFRYILIDEYQDTNHSQYVFAKLLADAHHNICVVGDDAQSIYSFRGATIENILNFEKDYPEAKTIKLEQNYRSTKKILAAGNRVIALNANQKQKELWTDNDDGETITVYEAMDEKDEARWIADKVRNLPGDDIAVLYRTNAQSRALEEALLQKAISYQIVGSTEFYKRKEIKDVNAYLRTIFNPKDDISVKRILNVPRRGIGPQTLANIENAANEQGKSLTEYLVTAGSDELAGWSKGVGKFAGIMKKLIHAAATETVDKLIELTIDLSGYQKSLDDGSSDGETRLENVRELITVAKAYSDLEPTESLERFLEEISLIENHSTNDDVQPTVRLMTIHSAKGLEFEFLFVAGMEEGLFPHSNSYLEPSEMEEERRLAYVAITRARAKLYLTHAQSRTFYGSRSSNPVSRFVTDIPGELVELEDFDGGQAISSSGWQEGSSSDFSDDSGFSGEVQVLELEPGDKVEHAHFGVGVVKDIDDSIITVGFKGGTKELARDYAKLVKI
ncbi:MAG: ATP-dependent helicase [Candidatus Dojkabacteria bacterium]